MANVGGIQLPVLHPVDGLGYTALHVLRHLLRGNVTAGQVYELAGILDRHAGNDEFWALWRAWHSPQLQRLEAVAFDLAKAWFGCATPLPGPSERWFREFAWSPLAAQFRANKDELWLHLDLLESAADRWCVARRRLLPSRLPGPVDAVYLPEMSWRRRWTKRLRYGAYVTGRMWHHTSTLPRTLGAGVHWWIGS
jgi:hypothetical protein